jgi:hypothetical protein
MRLDIHHLLTLDQGVLSRLDKIEYKLDLIISNQEAIMAAIDDLATAVAAEDTVIASAVVLLQGIPGLISAAGVDPAKLAALQTDIQNQTANLAAAVLVGTPVTSTVAGAPVVTAATAKEAAQTATAVPVVPGA